MLTLKKLPRLRTGNAGWCSSIAFLDAGKAQGKISPYKTQCALSLSVKGIRYFQAKSPCYMHVFTCVLLCFINGIIQQRSRNGKAHRAEIDLPAYFSQRKRGLEKIGNNKTPDLFLS